MTFQHSIFAKHTLLHTLAHKLMNPSSLPTLPSSFSTIDKNVKRFEQDYISGLTNTPVPIRVYSLRNMIVLLSRIEAVSKWPPVHDV